MKTIILILNFLVGFGCGFISALFLEDKETKLYFFILELICFSVVLLAGEVLL